MYLFVCFSFCFWPDLAIWYWCWGLTVVSFLFLSCRIMHFSCVSWLDCSNELVYHSKMWMIRSVCVALSHRWNSCYSFWTQDNHIRLPCGCWIMRKRTLYYENNSELCLGAKYITYAYGERLCITPLRLDVSHCAKGTACRVKYAFSATVHWRDFHCVRGAFTEEERTACATGQVVWVIIGSCGRFPPTVVVLEYVGEGRC